MAMMLGGLRKAGGLGNARRSHLTPLLRPRLVNTGIKSNPVAGHNVEI